MNGFKGIVSAVGVVVCAAGLAWGQAADKQPAKPEGPKAAQPAKPDAPKAPEGMPDMQAMMEAWMKAATPGPQHAELCKAAGVWDGKTKSWMMPGAPPEESTCTTTMTPRLGGRFMMSETKGTMAMGGSPMEFEGIGFSGYNNASGKYEMIWADNLGTMIMVFSGDASADGKTMTWMSHFKDPTGTDSWMKIVEHQTGPDAMKMEMFGPSMDGKGEMKMMEIEYKRKSAAPKSDAPKAAPKPAGS
jgi:hypothetical protein